MPRTLRDSDLYLEDGRQKVRVYLDGRPVVAPIQVELEDDGTGSVVTLGVPSIQISPDPGPLSVPDQEIDTGDQTVYHGRITLLEIPPV